MNKRKFNCTQRELYAVCSSGWELCSRNMESFKNFKTRYSPEYVAEMQESIRKSMELPGRKKRSAALEMLRQEVRELNNECFSHCLKLRRHMEEAWDDEDLRRLLKESGLDDLEPVRRQQFESTMVLMVNAALFATEHKAELEAGQNMPADYPEVLSRLGEQFRVLYAAYLDKLNNAGSETRDVIGSLNTMYDALSGMFADARVIFRNKPEIQKQFSFDTVLANVSGNGWAGIKGSITLGGLAFEPVEGLRIALNDGSEPIEADTDGYFQFSQLKSGLYTVTLSAPGYQTLQRQAQVKTGSYSQLNVDLQALPPAEQAPETPAEKA